VTRLIESGKKAEQIYITIGHSTPVITLETYFDAFTEYSNRNDKETQEYFEKEGLSFTITDEETVIKAQINKLEQLVGYMYVDEIDKQQLMYIIGAMRGKYLK